MTYNEILEKINLYNNTYVKGECRSREYESRIKQEKRLNLKLDLADTMFNELPFNFTKPQKQHVKEIIRRFPNFKELHSQATNEEIILSIIYYVKSLETKKTIIYQETLDKYVDPKKQERFKDIVEIIGWKITLQYISNSCIRPREPKNIDHNILYKGNYRWWKSVSPTIIWGRKNSKKKWLKKLTKNG